MAGFRGLMMFRVPYLYLMFSLYVFTTCIGFGTFLYISKALVITAHTRYFPALNPTLTACIHQTLAFTAHHLHHHPHKLTNRQLTYLSVIGFDVNRCAHCLVIGFNSFEPISPITFNVINVNGYFAYDPFCFDYVC